MEATTKAIGVSFIGTMAVTASLFFHPANLGDMLDFKGDHKYQPLSIEKPWEIPKERYYYQIIESEYMRQFSELYNFAKKMVLESKDADPRYTKYLRDNLFDLV